MSLSYTVDVHCDRCGNWVHGLTTSNPNTARQALKIAKEAGWSRDTKSLYVDLCPKCLDQYRKEK